MTSIQKNPSQQNGGNKKNVVEGEVVGERKQVALTIEDNSLNLEQNLNHFKMLIFH